MAASWVLFTYLAFAGFIVVLSTCPDGWIENDQECFWFGSHKMTWNDAEVKEVILTVNRVRDDEVRLYTFTGDGFCSQQLPLFTFSVRHHADCRKHNSYLTSDDNEDKHNFLYVYLNIFHSWRLGHFWLGGNDLAIESQWRWFESGSAIGTVTTFWDVGQPDGNSTANCMSFFINADNKLVWRDDRCTSHFNYVCEQPATGSTPLPVVG